MRVRLLMVKTRNKFGCRRGRTNITRMLRLAGVVCLLGVGEMVCALQPTTPLDLVGRQSWTLENGLPQNTITTLLQSASGYLWAGAELGLARFDGQNFLTLDHASTTHYPDAETRCLLDLSSGDAPTGMNGLWIGTGDGLVRWSNGEARLFTTLDGLPGMQIRGLFVSEKTLWVWTERGLAYSKDGLTFHAAKDGLPDGGITSVAVTRVALWVATTSGIAEWRNERWQRLPTASGPSLVAGAGDRSEAILAATGDGVFLIQDGKFDPARLVLPRSQLPGGGIGFLAQAADGSIAVASSSELVIVERSQEGYRVVARFHCGTELPGTRMESVYADREGALWIGTNRGLARVYRQKPDWMPTTDPLAHAAIDALLEDREGSLWVGTETSGLHILRDARFRFLGTGDGLTSDDTTAIMEDAQHTLWIGTREAGLNEIRANAPAKISSLTADKGLSSNVILSLASSRNGSLWIGTPDGLNLIENGTLRILTSADGLPDDFIRSLYAARDGSLWIGTRRGLTHYDPGRAAGSTRGGMQTWTAANGLGSDLVGAVAETGDGSLWVATLHGLSRLQPDRAGGTGGARNFTTADGLSGNVITALENGPGNTLWVGTQSHGLTLWDGSRFHAVPSAVAALLPPSIHGILLDGTGHLWMTSDDGLFRMDDAALQGCVLRNVCNTAGGPAIDPLAIDHLAIDHFTTADGLRSRETSNNSHPTLLRGHDGRLWFTTPRGVVTVDPEHFVPLPAEPPVVIEDFAVDDRAYAIDKQGTTRIPAGHLRFQIDYAGLSFAAPQKLRYEYMLEGFDRVWTEAGTRRSAYYTNIRPGRYRFRVRVAMGDPANGTQFSEADLDFVLQPHFYQTLWFYLLLALLLAGLVAGVIRWRLGLVRREFGAVMAERNRIAREIHDTLAQGYVGISVQLEVLGELLRHRRSEAAEKHLALTQTHVREGLEDARRSIWALRSQDAAEQTLPIRLRRMVEKAQDRRMATTFSVHGAYRGLAPEVEEELLRIAQEAIRNAQKHSRANQLSVRLEYDERMLLLTVSDNGIGFSVSAAPASLRSPEGHYGLTGIRERAAVIGATLTLASTPGNGATLRVEVAAPDATARQNTQPIAPQEK